MQGMANGDQATAPGVKDARKPGEAPVETSVTAGTPATDSPREAPAAVAKEAEAPKVTLRSIPEAVDEYPLSVSVVGPEEELVFENADTTIEVAPQVAEQITYLPNVEVAS